MPELSIVKAEDIPKEVVPVPKDDLASVYKLARQMEIICDKHSGLGLSAVQVGVPWNFFIVKWRKKYRHFADCRYTPLTETQTTSIEGCLSLPRKHYLVARWDKVLVEGLELIAKNGKLEYIEFSCETDQPVWSHEIDHGFGILISDIGKEVLLQPIGMNNAII